MIQGWVGAGGKGWDPTELHPSCDPFCTKPALSARESGAALFNRIRVGCPGRFPAFSPSGFIDQILTYVHVYRYDCRMFTLPKILKTRVKVSPKFQIVIPKAIREEMKIEPGQELFMYSL